MEYINSYAQTNVGGEDLQAFTNQPDIDMIRKVTLMVQKKSSDKELSDGIVSGFDEIANILDRITEETEDLEKIEYLIKTDFFRSFIETQIPEFGDDLMRDDVVRDALEGLREESTDPTNVATKIIYISKSESSKNNVPEVLFVEIIKLFLKRFFKQEPNDKYNIFMKVRELQFIVYFFNYYCKDNVVNPANISQLGGRMRRSRHRRKRTRIFKR